MLPFCLLKFSSCATSKFTEECVKAGYGGLSNDMNIDRQLPAGASYMVYLCEISYNCFAYMSVCPGYLVRQMCSA